jgi:hypothetical protein
MTGWLAAERSGADTVGPGAAWDPLAAAEIAEIGAGTPGVVIDHPARVKAAQYGDLAARMVTVACELACMVRDEDKTAISEYLDNLTPGPLPLEVRALLIVQAGMIPVDTAPADLLNWLAWDEYGRPLPGPVREPPAPLRASGPIVTQPCGTYAAYSRHKDRGELVDDDCQEAARTYWRERRRTRKTTKTPAARPARKRKAGPAPVTPGEADRHRAELEQALRDHAKEITRAAA